MADLPSQDGTLRTVHRRIEMIHAEFERRRDAGQPPPAWGEFDEAGSHAQPE